MKLEKVVVTIKAELTSIDSLLGKIQDMAKDLKNNEICEGKLRSWDGDQIEWEAERKVVEVQPIRQKKIKEGRLSQSTTYAVFNGVEQWQAYH